MHHRAQRLSVMSMHATMPLNFETNSTGALETFRAALFGESFSIETPASSLNKTGTARGRLVGGNLSIIYSLLGTADAYDFKNSVLFIEDLSEQLYHIDRMLFALKKAGIFDEIKALVIGGMTDLKDTSPSFGMTYEEAILEKVKEKYLHLLGRLVNKFRACLLIIYACIISKSISINSSSKDFNNAVLFS